MGRLYNRQFQTNRRRVLHTNLTPSEASLWKSLKQNKLEGKKFIKWQSFGDYTIKFYCPSEKLAVELDGDISLIPSEWYVEQKKEEFLRQQGIKIIRIKDDEVLQAKDTVLERIAMEFKTSTSTT
jgi:very-short-patch-repair endonuclease